VNLHKEIACVRLINACKMIKLRGSINVLCASFVLVSRRCRESSDGLLVFNKLTAGRQAVGLSNT
jgi:hypothetical protein